MGGGMVGIIGDRTEPSLVASSRHKRGLAIAAALTGGIAVGTAIGIVPVTLAIHAAATDCTALGTDRGACEALGAASVRGPWWGIGGDRGSTVRGGCNDTRLQPLCSWQQQQPPPRRSNNDQEDSSSTSSGENATSTITQSNRTTTGAAGRCIFYAFASSPMRDGSTSASPPVWSPEWIGAFAGANVAGGALSAVLLSILLHLGRRHHSTTSLSSLSSNTPPIDYHNADDRGSLPPSPPAAEDMSVDDVHTVCVSEERGGHSGCNTSSTSNDFLLQAVLLVAAALMSLGVISAGITWAGDGGVLRNRSAFAVFVASHGVIGLGLGLITVAAPQLSSAMWRQGWPPASSSPMLGSTAAPSGPHGTSAGNRTSSSGQLLDDVGAESTLLEHQHDLQSHASLPAGAASAPNKLFDPAITFAPAMAFGVFIVALCGAVACALADAPTRSRYLVLLHAYSVLNALQLAAAVSMALVVLVMQVAPRSASELDARLVDQGRVAAAASRTSTVATGSDDAATATSTTGGATFLARCGLAAIMCVALQCTGIVAVMSYAPFVTSAAGLSPLVGTAVVMGFNALAALFAPFTTSRSADPSALARLFVRGAVCASFACLMVAVPLLAGPSQTHGWGWSDAVVLVGCVAIVVVYELALAPPFYVLVQRLFPSGSERRRGAAVAIAIEFSVTLTINVSYPPLQRSLATASSSSAAHDGDGQGAIFAGFGVIGLVAAWAIRRYLHEQPLGPLTV